MKLFLDTADVASIQRGQQSGLINGVTTNPSLLSKEGGNILDKIQTICQLVYPNDVSVEVTQLDPEQVYNQAKAIAQIAPNVVVKIPCYAPYTALIQKLVDQGTSINITLVFSAVQGLMMSKLGVKYISPFVGRLDDSGVEGINLIAQLRILADTYNFKTQILAASLRHELHIQEAALAGADIATIPVKLFDSMLEHPLTKQGMALFHSDWQKLGINQFP